MADNRLPKGAMQHSSGKKKYWETSLIGSELTLSPYIFTTEHKEEEEVVTCVNNTEEVYKNLRPNSMTK
jgi:hypothetical protein